MNFAMEHILIVGGTGRLSELAKRFADEGRVVSVIGRSRVKLLQLVKETRTGAGIINPVMVDYMNPEDFGAKIDEAVTHLGPPTLVINRMQNNAEESRRILIEYLRENCGDARIFDLVGVDSYNDTTSDTGIPDNYCRVILGWKSGPEGSRWLNLQEITEGVKAAIDRDDSEFIIGSIKPKNEMPE